MGFPLEQMFCLNLDGIIMSPQEVKTRKKSSLTTGVWLYNLYNHIHNHMYYYTLYIYICIMIYTMYIVADSCLMSLLLMPMHLLPKNPRTRLKGHPYLSNLSNRISNYLFFKSKVALFFLSSWTFRHLYNI